MCFPRSTFFGSRGGDAPNQMHWIQHWSSTSLEKSADESVQPGWKCQHRNLDGLKHLWDFETFFTKLGSVSLLHLGGWNVWSLDIPMSVGHSNSELQIFWKNVSFILTALGTTIPLPPPKKNTHTRPESLRKLFEKLKISTQNNFFWAKTCPLRKSLFLFWGIRSQLQNYFPDRECGNFMEYVFW